MKPGNRARRAPAKDAASPSRRSHHPEAVAALPTKRGPFEASLDGFASLDGRARAPTRPGFCKGTTPTCRDRAPSPHLAGSDPCRRADGALRPDAPRTYGLHEINPRVGWPCWARKVVRVSPSGGEQVDPCQRTHADRDPRRARPQPDERPGARTRGSSNESAPPGGPAPALSASAPSVCERSGTSGEPGRQPFIGWVPRAGAPDACERKTGGAGPRCMRPGVGRRTCRSSCVPLGRAFHFPASRHCMIAAARETSS